MKGMRHAKQQGAVSLFVVIFAAMLMVVITVSFVKLMIQDQSEASATSLSQSAYDAAQAGVEDAKRLLLANQNNADAYPIPDTPSCDMVANGLGLTETDGAVQVQTSFEGSNSYDESYTCDEITKNTPDVTDTLGANQSVLIPITTTAPVSSINLDWFTEGDADTTKPAYLTTGIGLMPDRQFPQTGWLSNQPPVLRVQLIHIDAAGGFTLDDLDSNAKATKTSTLFFVPNGTGTATTVTNSSFALDATNHTQPSASDPVAVACLAASQTFAVSKTGYACNLSLTWDTKGTAWQDGTYLRITPLYNNTSISLNFGNDGTLFNNVEPQIDSTGRAATLYRRVSARVMHGNASFPMPVAAVNSTTNFCKAYVMAPSYSSAACTP